MAELNEDAAATKIQAIQRGRHARQEVQKKKEEESHAAMKIQALQRGRRDRQVVEQKKKELELFPKPLLEHTATHVIVKVSLAGLRQKTKTWESFLEALHGGEVLPVDRDFDFDNIKYSTSTNPDAYPNAFNAKILETLAAYDKSRSTAGKLRAEHEKIEAAKPPPPPPPPPRPDGEEGEDVPQEKPKTRKQLKEEEEQRKRDRERLKAVLEAEYQTSCLEQRLPNVLKLHALKIPVLP